MKAATPYQLEKLPKWAQHYLKETTDRLRLEASLRWPTEAEPEPIDIQEAAPKGPNRLVIGWFFHAHGAVTVTQGCSDGHRHSRHRTDRIDSQHSGHPMYWTKREALLAGRWAFCRQMAKELARVDAELEKCK